VRELRAGAEGRRTLRLCAAFLGVFALAAALFMALGPVAVRLAVNRVPGALEAKLGEKLAAGARENLRASDEAWAWARVGAVTNQLQPCLQRAGLNWRLHVVRGRVPNAMAYPGGHVFVTTGLLRLVETPEELAGVLAHELAHVTRRHGLQQLVAGLGPLTAIQLAFGDQQGLLTELLSSSVALAALSFSRNQEREADATAFACLAEAGVDPRGLKRFFLRLQGVEPDDPALLHGAADADDGDGGSDVLSTHPLTGERIRNMEALWEKLPRKERFQPMRWPAGAEPPEAP
jgi:predicted Zn-dependent protease